MGILHLETEQVLQQSQRLHWFVEDLREHVQTLNNVTERLRIATNAKGVARVIDRLRVRRLQLEEAIDRAENLSNRIAAEVREWEETAASLESGGISRSRPAPSKRYPNTLAPGSGQEYSIDIGGMASLNPNFGIEKITKHIYAIKLPDSIRTPPQKFAFDINNPEALINYKPGYIGKDAAGLLREVFKMQEDVLHDEHFLEDASKVDKLDSIIQKMADYLGISKQQAFDNFLLTQNYAKKALLRGDPSIFQPISKNLESHWGSIEQMQFGKVVGDSLGIHPFFAVLLNPSGGLIGPGGGFTTEQLNNSLKSDPAWRFHAVVHDAAGYLKNGHDIGPGFQYAPNDNKFTDNILSLVKPDLTGQFPGHRYWQNVLNTTQAGQEAKEDSNLSAAISVEINNGKVSIDISWNVDLLEIVVDKLEYNTKDIDNIAGTIQDSADMISNSLYDFYNSTTQIADNVYQGIGNFVPDLQWPW